jgi:hypothetical protein
VVAPRQDENGLTIDTGPGIKRRTPLKQFIGLDVSLKDTFIPVREEAGGYGGAKALPIFD